MGRAWRRVGRGLYCWSGLLDDPWEVLFAYQRLVPESVYAGSTAAWLHGIDMSPIRPIEVIVPARASVRSRPGLTAHHVDLEPADITLARGLSVTRIYRTLADMCLRLRNFEALAAIDEALRLR